MLASLIRTFVPLIVGWLVSLTFLRGIDQEALTSLVTVLVSGAYYAAVRLLEQLDGRWGWLLGKPGEPHYARHAAP